jgi:hypothetical protein
LFLCCASVYPTWCGGTKFFCFCVALNRRGQPQSSHTPHHTTGESGVESDPLHASLPAPQRRARGPRSPTALYCEVYPFPVRCPNGRSRSNGVCTPHPCNPCASRHPHAFFKPAASRRVRERELPPATPATSPLSFRFRRRERESKRILSARFVFFF